MCYDMIGSLVGDRVQSILSKTHHMKETHHFSDWLKTLYLGSDSLYNKSVLFYISSNKSLQLYSIHDYKYVHWSFTIGVHAE